MTVEQFTALSKILRDIDPGFQTEWRKSLLKTKPWLDRYLPQETPARNQ